ncbi:PREDICTED: protein CURVATURE THYLAKOID 1C, chloroplastic [Tarenaya hassleriana]|uniref:protein CURVATURE THYLAKOID 1C, chloroplastic n=1 Tax=Tarenaya hassleriana TaxID=28532 RepID=UPI00053C0901|nr:PREDICTED: protein CURVATURE THYLAKOID 1C, chloroplastic [Tarenaya hassleriana]
MASISASLPPPLLLSGRKSLLATIRKLPFSPPRDIRNRIGIGFRVKASGQSSESSTDLSVVKSVQNVWENSEDRIGIIGLGFAAVVALWASLNIVTAIDKLPVIPNALELVGILFSTWFTYRYLLFKPDREELSEIIKKTISNILGQ